MGALQSAVREDHRTVTEYPINQGADVKQATPYGRTSIVRHKATKVIPIHGANVVRKDKDGYSALHSAAQKGHLDVTKQLISKGAEVDKGDNEGRTALQIAAFIGHLDVTKYLIGQGAEVNNGDNEAEVDKGDNEGRTALHSAAQEGHLDVNQYLIGKGAEVDKGDNEGRTALHSATQEGHLEVTKYLIGKGAEMDKGDNEAEVNKGLIEGWTPLHSAACNGHINVTKCLIGNGAEVNKGDNEGRTALQSAAFNDHPEVTKYLIGQGAEVNKEDNKGRTALRGASQKGYLDVTKHLIGNGAKVNYGDNEGRTALHGAASQGHLDVNKYLIGAGAEVNKADIKTDVNKGDIEGWTAFKSAAHEGHLDVTKYLIGKRAEVNKGDNEGRTALHSAAQGGYLDVTKYLIGQGAEVNNGDNEGKAALPSAASNGRLDVTKYLIAQRAELAQNDSSEIHLAIQHGHTSVIEKLVSEGADLNVQSTDGQTCLHKAIKLCYKTDRIVQETNTLKKISDEYYTGELSPERALVLYLLENGAKLDVKDETGNLPIQYAKDEVLKQMILWRLASLDEIPSFRDEPSTPTIVSAEVERHIRQEIELEGLGVSMLIPPEAVHQSDPCRITLALLRDPPRDDIQDDESVACYGIRCDPPNMIFHKPVKIRIPHSTLAINPDQVKPYIVSKVWDSVNDLPKTSRNRSSSSPSKLPYCRMYEEHLELYIGHCAEWWVLIPLEQQVIRHQLMCTPYIPETVERGKKIEVHLHIHADVPGIDTEVLHDEKHQSYRKAHHSVPFSIISNSGDVTVARDCEGRIAETKLISLKKIHHPMRHNVVLKVPPSEDDTPYDVITITLTQSGNQGMSRSMTFSIRYEDQTKSPEFTPVIRSAGAKRRVRYLTKTRASVEVTKSVLDTAIYSI
ncbi:ankyrin repeat domain-containing protein 50-like [Strongylocentrotus purpuratus]|uniref:ZU5 domain-containing protein n=1 Tax=Strongylocentrotus purpuratus TaxID=7668 RepID=A0A7M7NE62_STRPU|nr:ankyrin repeat domain-containing protein 50-like [Strongylocentrotus purpuratus]